MYSLVHTFANSRLTYTQLIFLYEKMLQNVVWILIIVASVLVESGTNDNLTLEHKRKVLMSSPDVMGIKRLLEDRGYVIIPGQIMKDVLRQYGAVEEDFQVLESGAIHKYLPLDQQPAMRHRLVNIVTQLLQTPE